MTAPSLASAALNVRPASSSPTSADENALRPERGDVARDVASAADLDRVVRHLQNRRRRLRRNPRDFAVDEIVEHDVADAKNGLLRNQP